MQILRNVQSSDPSCADRGCVDGRLSGVREGHGGNCLRSGSEDESEERIFFKELIYMRA
jgi:hypothetical protein